MKCRLIVHGQSFHEDAVSMLDSVSGGGVCGRRSMVKHPSREICRWKKGHELDWAVSLPKVLGDSGLLSGYLIGWTCIGISVERAIISKIGGGVSMGGDWGVELTRNEEDWKEVPRWSSRCENARQRRPERLGRTEEW